jgi:nucleoside phosphorylase
MGNKTYYWCSCGYKCDLKTVERFHGICPRCAARLRFGEFEVEVSGHDPDDVARVSERLLLSSRTQGDVAERSNMTGTAAGIYAVVICAVEREYRAVQAYLPPRESINSKGSTAYRSQLDDKRQVVVLLLQQMGNMQAAIETQRAIDVWNPQFLLLTGIAGGFPGSDRHLGDVIVADQLVYYEIAKLEVTDVNIRPQVYRPSPRLISAARSIAQNPTHWSEHIRARRPGRRTAGATPRIHIGAILSGDKIVANKEFLKNFREAFTNIIGVEMEGAGLGLAVYRSETQPEFLLVKGICDWADKNKNDEWQEYAAHAAAALVLELLLSISAAYDTDEIRAQPERKKHVNCAESDRWNLCKRLYSSWLDIANYCDIPKQDRARFDKGSEMLEIWGWLRDRDKLDSLHVAVEVIERNDIVQDFPCIIPQ